MTMAANPLIPNDGVITIEDGAATPLSVIVKYEDGDFSLSDIAEGNSDVQLFLDRGVPYSLRKTTKKVLKVSFSCHAVALGDGSVGNPLDAIRKKGAWAAATSTFGDASSTDAHCVRIKWVGERTDFNATADAHVYLEKVRITSSFAEGTPGKLSFEGEVYVTEDADVDIA